MKKYLNAIFYGIRWGWNPTKTKLAIKLVETFFNESSIKTNQMLSQKFEMQQPLLAEQFKLASFKVDISTHYDLESLRNYPDYSLGKEYYLFMQKLGYQPLDFNITENTCYLSKAVVSLAIKNHDLIHLLYRLYDSDREGKYHITEFHEYMFLAITSIQQDEKHIVPFIINPNPETN
jgi:ubiquinone biosynthesis protein Coq4